MTKVDYKLIKGAIIKSCSKVGKYTNDFKINKDQLNTILADQNLEALPISMEARQVEKGDMYAVAEYFNGENLKWFDHGKFITTIICIDKDDVTEEVAEKIKELEISHEDNPEIDHVHIIAELLATCHCYYVMVVSYKSNDPGRANKNSYYINCRANKVVLRDPNYVYNSKDIA